MPKSQESTANNYQIVLPIKGNIQKLLNFLNENYSGGFTIPKDGKTLIINTTVDEKTFISLGEKSLEAELKSIDELVDKLIEGDLYEEQRGTEKTPARFYNLGRTSRQNLYQTWLENHDDLRGRGEKGSLFDLVKQAKAVNDYLIERTDSNGDVDPKAPKNAEEILSLLSKETRYSRKDVGPEKIVQEVIDEA